MSKLGGEHLTIVELYFDRWYLEKFSFEYQ